MATPPGHVKMYSSAVPVSVWGGLALVAVASALLWLLPQARQLVGAGLAAAVVIGGVLMVLRRRSKTGGDSPAAPLHLRD
jgi:hypothetical protein